MGILIVALLEPGTVVMCLRPQQEIKVAKIHALYFGRERLVLDENKLIIQYNGRQ